jgi:2-methylcitrate dehydratase PrpD
MSVTRALAEWSAGTPPLPGEPGLTLARNAFIDIVACMIAGAGDAAASRVFDAVADLGPGPATVVGRSRSLPAPNAALVNGTAAHALDFDDNFHPLAGHATAVLAPALLALAEERGAGGAAVLDAYAVGLEVIGRIGDGVNLQHYERGWHSTSTVGAIGSAAACARLMRLDVDGVQRAISLGSSLAGGSKRQFGTMAKPLHAGLAAQHGLLAARLAAADVSATAEPLDGAWGFKDLFAGPDSPGFREAAGRIGAPLALETYGLKVKIHPCCASAHCAVDGVLSLMREHALAAGDVERVETVVSRISHDNLMFPEPRSELEARFSMQYCVAVAVLRGALRLADFQPAAIAEPAVRAWLPCISMDVPAAGSELSRADNGREPAEVRLHLKDGRVLSAFVQHAKGVLENPLSEAELWSKFDDCVAGVLPPERAATIRARLERFEQLPRAAELMTALRGPHAA